MKYIVRAVGLILIVFLFFLGSLFFREQRLPHYLVGCIERRLSTETIRTRIDFASFGFRHGLRVQGVRVYDLTRANSLEDPIIKAHVVSYDYWRDRVDIVDLVYPRLPDSYYQDTPTEPDKPGEDPFAIDLPDIPPLHVRLARPFILGVQADRVRLLLDVDRRRISLQNIHVRMADQDRRLQLDGDLAIDLDAKEITGGVKGFVGHSQIAPVIEVLDIDVALPYVAAFTELPEPIPATVTWKGGLADASLDLRFFLDVPRCRYQGVPMAKAKGAILINSRYDENDELKYSVTIRLEDTIDRDGRPFSGRLTIDNEKGPVRLDYDAASGLKFADLMALIDVFDPKSFDCVAFDSPPEVTVKGTNGITEEDLDGNDLSGTLSLLHGSVIGLKMNEVKSTFSLKRDVLETQNTAKGKTGGLFSWKDKTSFNGFKDGQMQYELSADYKGGSLEELSDLFSFDLGERHGRVDANLELSGQSGTNTFASLNGKGTVRITDGRLAQMKLFAGLTEILADSVPGVSYLVNQSQASTRFVIEDGVFKSDSVTVEGGLISIDGRGRYDIVKDDLDFIVRMRLFKKDSLVGKVVHPLTAPLAWMLMELKLTGPLDNPTWRRITLTDRLF